MEAITGIYLMQFFTSFQQVVAGLDPAYMDIAKIFAGSTFWIGGLTLFMWLREKRKVAVAIS